MPKATKPADDCGCCWAFQEQVTDGLALAEARATRERAACLLRGSLVDVGLVRPTHQAAMQNAPPQDSVLSVKVP